MYVIIGKFLRCLVPSHKSNLIRYMSASQCKLSENDVEEIEIPVPWGHIAGKWWGDKLIPPVLAVHGWQDNANSFDKLIPLLCVPSVLAIDLPGHGLSSHFLEGRAYDFGEHVVMLHRIKKYFNWEKMPLLTHSLGAAIGYAYASMFPDDVKWVVNFECSRTLLPLLRSDIHNGMSRGIDEFLKTENIKKEGCPPAYKLSDMIKMTIEGSLGSVASPEAALTLLKRGVNVTETPSLKTDDKILSDLGDFVSYEKQAVMSLPEEERENSLKVFLELTESISRAKKKLETFPLAEGRWWGPKNRRPILCLHGWQDNANTFNTLIPQLSHEFSYLAIDLPGHGLSSYYPKGFLYRTYDIGITIRRVQNYFGWNKVSLMGHSYGAICSFLFSSLFSNSVDFFVAIDGLKPQSKDSSKDIKNAAKNVEKLLFYESLDISTAPSYSRDDLVKVWIKASNNALTENSCKFLIERGTVESNGKFKLRRDPRVKTNFSVNFTHKENLKLAEAITCNVLFLKATDASYFEKKEFVLEVLSVIKKNAKYFEEHLLTGTHYIHLNNPEVVAPVINSFVQTVGGQELC